MSSGLPWLQRQRKSELLDFAKECGLGNLSHQRKEEVAAILDEELARDPNSMGRSIEALIPYYEYLSAPAGSPRKRGPRRQSTINGSSPAPAPTRRIGTRKSLRVMKEETPPPSDSSAESSNEEMAKSPSTAKHAFEAVKSTAVETYQYVPSVSTYQRASSNIPPSPAVVTDAIEVQTRDVACRLDELLKASHIEEYIRATRDFLSHATTVEGLGLLMELYALHKEIIPYTPFTHEIPGLSRQITVPIPDLFILLSTAFWSPFSLWLSTSLFLPLFSAYFINLKHTSSNSSSSSSSSSSKFDPLIFNVSKLLLSWLVYAQGWQMGGWVAPQSIERVDSSVGYVGICVGAGVGALLSFWEVAVGA
ncbi:MAG: hypothetical protein M1834_008650 [Cirrosporium novae-zelandiae]|nr:MAG: hypothetical protein M1834_008650 [Cirrosporium novae-zelandiae]